MPKLQRWLSWTDAEVTSLEGNYIPDKPLIQVLIHAYYHRISVSKRGPGWYWVFLNREIKNVVVAFHKNMNQYFPITEIEYDVYSRHPIHPNIPK